MSKFYFHWAEPTDTTWSTDFKTDDENVFGFTVQHSEGDFPSLDVQLVNPHVGLLTAGRKQWAWLTWTDDSAVDHPLFFGRLVGIPQSLQDEVIQLTFIARPLDYEAQQNAILLDAQENSPVYDPVWLSDDDLLDPNSVLETESALWHIDRTSLLVTISDIIVGEDGNVEFGGDDAFYDSLDVSYSQSPASRCTVTATVNWTQRGSGGFPIGDQIVEAFKAGNITKGLVTIRNNPVSGHGMIAVIPGKDMLTQWPKVGNDFGGGWTVTKSAIAPVGGPPLDPVLITDASFKFQQVLDLLDGSTMQGMALRQIFERSPGFVVQVVPTWVQRVTFGIAHGPLDILWFPIWLLAIQLEVGWDVARPRQEVVTFTLEADVQPLLTDPGADDTIQLSVGPADVDTDIEHITGNRYFNGPNGRRAFQSLIARARAALLARARAVNIDIDCTFEKAITLSCRKNATITDSRLPLGIAGGKVIGYSFSADGDSGTLLGHLTIGATVGHDGEVSVEPGTPEYCSVAYVTEYQESIGSTVNIPGYTDLTYGGLDSYMVDDDGVDLNSVRRNEFLTGITITGTVDVQQETVQNDDLVSSPAEVIAKASGFTTEVEVQMRPITDNSFVTNIAPTISVLKIPRTIDLETDGETTT